jgi:hypothetical protein
MEADYVRTWFQDLMSTQFVVYAFLNFLVIS